MVDLNRTRGCLLGLAVGDAVGTTVEFCARGTFPLVMDMTGSGPFSLEAGQWTDDTSMALCLATSLVACHGFDAHDQMRRYLDWSHRGYLSSNGVCFGIGNTVAAALNRYVNVGDPFAGSKDTDSAGNGSIMRLAPIPMYYEDAPDEMEDYAVRSSRTTHGATECLDACRLLALIIRRALVGESKEQVILGESGRSFGKSKITSIARADYTTKTEIDIRGTGYVVDSLEAAMWCFSGTDDFRAAILKAANLGDDADTTAASVVRWQGRTTACHIYLPNGSNDLPCVPR
jgi:ADP-ribosyl-[dinitrogen reductase] hydrolase